MGFAGSNLLGELGDGTTTNRYAPASVVGITGARQISSGNTHTCAVTSGHGVKCWGVNDNGELGDGSTVPRKIPVDVVGLTNANQVSAGEAQTCAVTTVGTVKCWGNDSQGQLGDNQANGPAGSETPVTVIGIP